MIAGVIVGIVVVVLLVIVPIMLYNNLVTLSNRYKNGFTQIDVQLQRRHDLIPNLVETAKGYLAHEHQTLREVVEARSQAVSAGQMATAAPGDPAAMQKLSTAEGDLGRVLGRLMAVVESYPDLKANQEMIMLMEELSSTENKVSFARQAYNDSVMEYNNARQVFPSVIIAGMCNFQAAAPFHVETADVRLAPAVKF